LAPAAAAEDPEEFWRVRQPFVALVPYLRTFHTATRPLLPAGIANELGQWVEMAELAIRQTR
jgi:hypothetical protein